jgi:acyl-CoA synthetase (AMP-forming)/AMP-acid ligase II
MTSLTQLGATIVLAHAIDAPMALRVISEERITIMAQTPTFYISMSRSEDFHNLNVSTLRRCITYGGTVPKSMIDSWGSVARGLYWGTYWGQSELSQLGTVGWFKTLDDVPSGDASWIGKPVPQLETRIVDALGEDAEEGELVCRSPSVMLGYFKDGEKTRSTVKDGWLHTGDLVRTDADGNLFFRDRKKDMIKTGGLNVSSVEVERTIYEFPGIQEVAVVGIPDPYWSEAVTAFVVTKPGEGARETELLEFCKSRLAPFKVPKTFRFVDSLPKDSQGKILKRELRKVEPQVNASPG